MHIKNILIGSFFLLSLNISAQTADAQLNLLIQKGEFSSAEKKIDSLVTANDWNVENNLKLLFQKELLSRIRLDFRRTGSDIKNALTKYYPELSDSMISRWEEEGSLEMKIIDGEKRYFNNAVPNLFRVNKDAKKRKLEIDGPAEDKLDALLINHIPEIINEAAEGITAVKPVKMKITYTIKVKPGNVPKGELIRAWLPFPKSGYQRQSGIKLLSVNTEDYILSPDNYTHKSLYLEKQSMGDEPTEFQISFEYTSSSQWFDLGTNRPAVYDMSSILYKEFTSEKAPHIVFTDKIKTLSSKIISGDEDTYSKIKKIAVWINENIPWASAREYSTIENISDYCLANMHGDCGIKTLLFITLARYNGIPAKWQSGWMMHPSALNLHDWAEVYIEGSGWVPVDPDFGIRDSDDERVKYFYTNGIDSYRMIVNDGISGEFFPAKIFPRSETVDFQRGEVEWRGGNLYFDKWSYDMDVEYID